MEEKIDCTKCIDFEYCAWDYKNCTGYVNIEKEED